MRYKIVFVIKKGTLCYKRGYLFFIKLGTLVIKLDTIEDIVIKIGTRVIKVDTIFTGIIPSLTKVPMKIVVEARLFISRPFPLVYFVLVFT